MGSYQNKGKRCWHKAQVGFPVGDTDRVKNLSECLRGGAKVLRDQVGRRVASGKKKLDANL